MYILSVGLRGEDYSNDRDAKGCKDFQPKLVRLYFRRNLKEQALCLTQCLCELIPEHRDA